MDLLTTIITTQRLVIVPMNETHAADIFRELTPEVATYLSFNPTGKIEDTYTFITNAQVTMKNGVEMPVVASDKVTKEFIGCAGIHKIKTGEPELGIWLKKSAHKQGYGKEILQGLIDWAKKHLEYETLMYPVAKANIASRKLAESLEGTLVGEQVYTSSTGKVLDEEVYRIRKFR